MQISIIIPVYNYGRYLKRAIDSAIEQQSLDPEILVIDDGSTDDTWEIMQSYGLRIRALRQANSGVSAARNRAIAEASGDLIGFLDADDFYHPDKLKKQIALLTSRPDCGWTYCDCKFYDEDTNTFCLFSERYKYKEKLALDGPRLFESLIPSNFISPLPLLVRKECLDKAGAFDKRFSGIEDFDFVLRLAASAPAVYSPEVLATYTWHSESLGKNQTRMDHDKQIILDKIASLYPEKIRNCGKAAKKALANMNNWFAYRHIEKQEWKEAARRLQISLTTYPLQRRALWVLLLTLIQVVRNPLVRG
ncbi:MAG: glycosyltransferase family 2 protein [Candidatus Hodarchaeota archaeon]